MVCVSVCLFVVIGESKINVFPFACSGAQTRMRVYMCEYDNGSHVSARARVRHSPFRIDNFESWDDECIVCVCVVST